MDFWETKEAELFQKQEEMLVFAMLYIKFYIIAQTKKVITKNMISWRERNFVTLSTYLNLKNLQILPCYLGSSVNYQFVKPLGHEFSITGLE